LTFKIRKVRSVESAKTVSESAIIADFAKFVLGFAKPSEGGFGLGQMDYFCSLKIEEKE
jgi:hypothetical protein